MKQAFQKFLKDHPNFEYHFGNRTAVLNSGYIAALAVTATCVIGGVATGFGGATALAMVAFKTAGAALLSAPVFAVATSISMGRDFKAAERGPFHDLPDPPSATAPNSPAPSLEEQFRAAAPAQAEAEITADATVLQAPMTVNKPLRLKV
jgi:hypothetical protein